MNITQKTISLSDIVLAGDFKHMFPWGDTLPGSLSTFKPSNVDFDGNNLSLSIKPENEAGYYYEGTDRIEVQNYFTGGAFITDHAFPFGHFTFKIKYPLFVGMSLIVGLFTSDFKQCILGINKNIETDLDYLKSLITIDSFVNSDSGEAPVRSVRFSKNLNPEFTITWLPDLLQIVINGKIVFHTIDKAQIPYEGLNFGALYFVNSQRAVMSAKHKLIVQSFNFIPA